MAGAKHSSSVWCADDVLSFWRLCLDLMTPVPDWVQVRCLRASSAPAEAECSELRPVSLQRLEGLVPVVSGERVLLLLLSTDPCLQAGRSWASLLALLRTGGTAPQLPGSLSTGRFKIFTKSSCCNMLDLRDQ